MHSKQKKKPVTKAKRLSILALDIFAILIILAGAAFTVFSAVNGTELPVLTSQVPGALFGAIIAFLGVRYLLAVQKLKAAVYEPSAQFSWSNFQKRRGRRSKANG